MKGHVSIEAQRGLIAAKYNAQARDAKATRRPRSVLSFRGAEIERLIRHRYGRIISDTKMGLEALMCRCELYVLRGRDVEKAIQGFLMARAPWALSKIDEIIARAVASASWQTADELGWRLQLSLLERSSLRIHTIGPAGVSKRQRKIARKEANRLEKAKKRLENGATPRALSLSQRKPWESLGISRATFYRRINAGLMSASKKPTTSVDDVAKRLVVPVLSAHVAARAAA